MKFLCVPCDSPMKLQTVGPPERGSLPVVDDCPECGYEMAMLTNPFETQLVTSLGVRIGPSTELGAGPEASSTESTSGAGAKCPFVAMIPTTEGAGSGATDESIPVRWTAAAEARLENIPSVLRPTARTGIEKFAREQGAPEADDNAPDAA